MNKIIIKLLIMIIKEIREFRYEITLINTRKSYIQELFNSVYKVDTILKENDFEELSVEEINEIIDQI